MKRPVLIFLAVVSLMPFYAMVCMCAGGNNFRAVYPFYVNEPRREARPDLPYDVGANPPAPHLSLHGYKTTACLEASLGQRHIVVNMPWIGAFALVSIVPGIWISRLLVVTYRRRSRAGEPLFSAGFLPRALVIFVVAIVIGIVLVVFMLPND